MLKTRQGDLIVPGKGEVPLLAFSVAQFCRAHGISESNFYNLKKAGLAPRIMRVRGRTLISAEAAADWRREREAQ